MIKISFDFKPFREFLHTLDAFVTFKFLPQTYKRPKKYNLVVYKASKQSSEMNFQWKTLLHNSIIPPLHERKKKVFKKMRKLVFFLSYCCHYHALNGTDLNSRYCRLLILFSYHIFN